MRIWIKRPIGLSAVATRIEMVTCQNVFQSQHLNQLISAYSRLVPVNLQYNILIVTFFVVVVGKESSPLLDPQVRFDIVCSCDD